jgi:hypothetical protein
MHLVKHYYCTIRAASNKTAGITLDILYERRFPLLFYTVNMRLSSTALHHGYAHSLLRSCLPRITSLEFNFVETVIVKHPKTGREML